MEENPFIDAPIEVEGGSQKILNVLQIVVVVAVIFVAIYLFVITPNQIDGQSMMPTFEDKEVVLTNRIVQWTTVLGLDESLGYGYQRGDIVIFYALEREIVKRVIALPGDTIAIVNQRPVVNGKQINEEYIPAGVPTNTYDFLKPGEVKTVPADSYFVMGDNRLNSTDSRATAVGFVKRDQIIGKVILRAWPLNKLTPIGTGKTT